MKADGSLQGEHVAWIERQYNTGWSKFWMSKEKRG